MRDAMALSCGATKLVPTQYGAKEKPGGDPRVSLVNV
jgi:hypothetical protein